MSGGDYYDPGEPPPWVGGAPSGSSRRPNNQNRGGGRSGGGRGSYQRGGYRSNSGGRSRDNDRGEYVEVRERIQEFYLKYPDGRLTSEIYQAPEGSREDAITSQIIAITEQEYTAWEGDGDNRQKVTKRRPSAAGLVIIKAYAYRSVDDPMPGVGHSWMLMPGTTPYTFSSELENAETSAWGRAIAACGIAISKGIASGSEVRKASGADEGEPAGEQQAGDATEAAEKKPEAAQAARPAKASPSRSRRGNREAQDGPQGAGAVPRAAEPTETAPVSTEGQLLDPKPDTSSSGEPTPSESSTDSTQDGTNDPNGEQDSSEPVGLSLPAFLESVKTGFVHSTIVNRVRTALYPDTSRVADLDDYQRADLWDAILEDIRLAAQEADEKEATRE